MRKQRNKLSKINRESGIRGFLSELGNFFLNMAWAVVWLLRWMARLIKRI